MPSQLVAVIGGAAGLGAAFRSPLLAVAYGLEELGQRSGLPLVLPVLLLAGSGTLLATTMGQPARLPGLELGSLAPELWGWMVVLTLVGAAAGALFVRLLLPTAAWVKRLLTKQILLGALLLAAILTLLAFVSGGLSLNDGSLSLAAALSGEPAGEPLLWLWPPAGQCSQRRPGGSRRSDARQHEPRSPTYHPASGSTRPQPP